MDMWKTSLWGYSSVHRYIQSGLTDKDWGVDLDYRYDGDFGEIQKVVCWASYLSPTYGLSTGCKSGIVHFRSAVYSSYGNFSWSGKRQTITADPFLRNCTYYMNPPKAQIDLF